MEHPGTKAKVSDDMCMGRPSALYIDLGKALHDCNSICQGSTWLLDLHDRP